MRSERSRQAKTVFSTSTANRLQKSIDEQKVIEKIALI
jgi:hypothetical protein